MAKGADTRNRILKKTRKLIVKKGFNNTSISDIITATGVKKGNLYYYYASKNELGLAVLKDAEQEFFDLLSASFKGEKPLEKLWNSCAAILKAQQKANFVGGCLFGNTALEMSGGNEEYAEIIREVFRKWTALLADHLRQAVSAGDLAQVHSPESLAKMIVAVIEGGIMMSRVSKRKTDLEDCLQTLRAILAR
ncbi:MAG: TetR/AcrR family transcriptional regulator [Thermodesulfobacteriota bacterium]